MMVHTNIRRGRGWARLLTSGAAVLLLAGGPAAPAARAATPVPHAGLAARAITGSPAALCAGITAGRVRGLRTRPAAVTFALAARAGATNVTVTRCARTASGGYGPAWSTAGRIGRHGFAPAGAKREGDGRSPSGIYRFGTAFGAADPGSRVGYLRLRPTSCWGSSVGSSRYIRYFTGRCGPADESLYRYVRGAYRQALVIDYNTSPIRQGRGSAIFFHVGTGGPTAGCVSVPLWAATAQVRATRPGDVIVMGVASGLVGSA